MSQTTCRMVGNGGDWHCNFGSKREMPVATISVSEFRDEQRTSIRENCAEREAKCEMRSICTQKQGTSRGIPQENRGSTAGVVRRLMHETSTIYPTETAGQLLPPDVWEMEGLLADPADFPSESSFGWGGIPPHSVSAFLEYTATLPYSAREHPQPSPLS